MRRWILGFVVLAIAAMVAVHAVGIDELVLFGSNQQTQQELRLVGFDSSEPLAAEGVVELTNRKGYDSPSSSVSARRGPLDGVADAVTLVWNDVGYAGLKLEGDGPLDFGPYIGRGALEFDLKVEDLSKGGISFRIGCGKGCNRKLAFLVEGRRLQGQGWQHLAFSLKCFARPGDDFSKVTLPFALDGAGAGEVAVANIRLTATGTATTSCPDYRTQPFTPVPLTHAWPVTKWVSRHEQKLADHRRFRENGQLPELIFIGDSITEGWETTGATVLQRHYARYRPVSLGFSGDHTENVLWRLQQGELEHLAPKVAVVMIGTNNSGDREDAPTATAAGVQRIVEEIRQRLPRTKVLLLAIFPRGAERQDPKRALNDEINRQLVGLADGRTVYFLNINSAFLENDGSVAHSLMPDFLHLNELGYERWASRIDPILLPLLAD